MKNIFKPHIHEIPETHRALFIEETKNLMHQRVYAILIVAITLIPLFIFLDLVVVPELLNSFFVYRLSCAFVFICFLGFYTRHWCRTHPFIFAISMYILGGGMISIMIVKMGGYQSSYYVGLILVLITCSVNLPLNTIQSIQMGLLTYLIYVIPVVEFCEITVPHDLRVFYAHNFFFVSFILITVLQSWQDTRLRVRRFKLKMQLEFYAHHLEDEVENRAKKLEESELRYRDLYDNIVDMVILVNQKGKVIMANPRFYSLIGFDEGHEGMALINYIHPDDYFNVRYNLLEKLPEIESVNNFEFRIVNVLGEVFDVECNAKQIKKQTHHVGFQMVIRDITERKRLETMLIESYNNLQNARSSTILGLAKLAEYRDHSTGAHLERIREYARILARELSKLSKYTRYITDDYIEDIYQSSILHDIGKVGIPDAILMKPSKLLPKEFEVIKRHTTFGGDALKAVEATIPGQSFLTIGKEIAYHHHEKWDGSGYPMGLKGNEIPLSTRIVALADVYDALTSKRQYKQAYSHEEATRILVAEKGKHFDPDVVDVFMANENKFRAMREKINQDLNCEH